MWYILDGRDVVASDAVTAARFLTGSDERIIKRTYLGPYFISTVFLGLDHRMGGDDGDPVLFETMVFETDSENADLYQDRYTTYDDAVEGHNKTVEMVKGWGPPREAA